MRKISKLVFMSEAEYLELAAAVRTSDQQFACGYREGFNAGKWHSAGGYGKCLVATKAKLKAATALLEGWLPLVEALETTPGQFTVTP